jgi:undecaprenyl diphosphate synthase
VSPSTLDTGRLPRHVGIIMDGNGRWARQQGKARSEGHLEGGKAAKRVVAAAAELGLPFLSLFVFSTENWARTAEEVSYLMFLVRSNLRKELDFYSRNGIRIVHSGDLAGLPPEISGEIEDVSRETAGFGGLTLNLAINYGGRDEILRAVHRAQAAGTAAGLTQESFRAHLDQPAIPDPDLVIRTGGERRLSNFLLWESAYAELYFSAKLWPDWDRQDLVDALVDYCGRSRRFGGAE